MRGAIGGAALALVLLGTSCTRDPGVQTSGADTYTVSTRQAAGNAGLLIAQNIALADARAFCAAQGRRFRAVSDGVEQDRFSSEVTYTVRFHCPEPRSPELERPTVNQTPDLL